MGRFHLKYAYRHDGLLTVATFLTFGDNYAAQ
jgi:hypothetical protein